MGSRSRGREIDHRKLLRRLGKAAVEALEAAAEMTVRRHDVEITIAHFFRSALEVEGSDVRALVQARGLLESARKVLDQHIEELPGDRTSGRPTFARLLLELMADADDLAFSPCIRTGTLLAALLEDPDSYACGSWVGGMWGSSPWSLDAASLCDLEGTAKESIPLRPRGAPVPAIAGEPAVTVEALAERVSSSTGVAAETVTAVLRAAIAAWQGDLKRFRWAQIPDLATMRVAVTAALPERRGISPFTKEPITLPATPAAAAVRVLPDRSIRQAVETWYKADELGPPYADPRSDSASE
mgnify:CR=1 FL=1